MVGSYLDQPGENAMSAVCRFVAKFASLIVCTLHCFDRVIFKGHSSLAVPRHLEYFVDCVFKVRRCDFIKKIAPEYSDRLVEHAQRWARKAGRTYLYRCGQFRKDEWATVINAPQEFSVYRTRRHADGRSSLGYFPMTKSVHSLVDYQAQALACNRRSLEALAVGDDPAPAYQDLRQLTEPQVVKQRSYAGFNPARRDDVRLFLAVLQGDGIARGFRNADIRSALFAVLKTKDQQRRASAAVGRLLKRLHVRQLLAKIPRTRRWRVTERGRHLLGLAVQLYRQSWPQLAA
jgi:hypothetical protein